MNTSNSSKGRSFRSRLANLAKNLALFTVVFLLCFAAAEFVLRVAGYGNVEIYEPDPLVFWRLKPDQNCYTKIDHKPVRINARGTRGREFDVAKPADTVRILCLGDSRTFGWGLSDEETYSARLEHHLQQQFGAARRVEVLNAGVNAWSYPQMSLFFRERALAWQPDMVILAGANLWTQFSERSDPEFVRKFMGRVRLKNALRRFALYHYIVEVKLEDVYQRFRTRFIPVDPQQDQLFKEQQQKDPNAVFREAIESLCRTAQTNGVRPVLMYLPDQRTLLGASNTFVAIGRVKAEISTNLQVPFLDLTPDLQPKAKDLYLDADPVHLNALGNEIVGRRLFEFVGPLLKP